MRGVDVHYGATVSDATQVHRIVLLVVDHDDLGANGVIDVLENVRYPNHCIYPKVMTVDTCVTDWTDDHPLNSDRTMQKEFEKMFDRVDDAD